MIGRPIPAPYQYFGNDGHSFSTEESYKIHSQLLCYDLDREYSIGFLYQQTGRNTFSQPVCRGMKNPPLVPGIWHPDQSLSYPRHTQHIGRLFIKIRQASQNRMGFRSVGSKLHLPMLNYPNVDLFATRFNQKLPLYVSPVPDNHDALSVDWNCFHAYAFPPTILCTSQDSTISVQNSSYCSSVAPAFVVFRGFTTISISSNSSSALSKTADISKRKVSASKSPITRSSGLRVIKQSIRDKKFLQSVADFKYKKIGYNINVI